MEAGFVRSLGLLPMVHAIGASPFRIIFNRASVICDRLVWSRFLEAVSTSAKRNFLIVHPSISARFGQGVCGAAENLVALCIR